MSNIYKMPPEWSSHSATQIHWPSNKDTWPGERLEKVEYVYLAMIKALYGYERIHLFIENEQIYERAIGKISAFGINPNKLIIHVYPINDVWARDCGPVFVQSEDREFIILDWEYNTWGDKYPPYEEDNRLPEYIAEMYSLQRVQPGMVLEGGSIDVNGGGVLLTTESVLLNKNRNPGLSKEEIENRLKKYLGIEQIIWLRNGLAGDDTDGHIDGISRFLNKDTILTMVCTDKEDVNYSALQENLEILKSTRQTNGKSFNIETLPLPETRIEGSTADGSEHVPASYANFYIANGVVLVPLYDDRYDRQALDLFSKYFPEREVIGIPCSDLVWGQGSIHCITQQWYGI